VPHAPTATRPSRAEPGCQDHAGLPDRADRGPRPPPDPPASCLAGARAPAACRSTPTRPGRDTVDAPDLPLGLLPQGTFNCFGRAHGVPTEPEAAARALLRARPVPIRVGRVGGRVLLVNASVGLYPDLLEHREAWKRRWGRSRAVALLAALATLARGVRPLRLELTTGGATRTVRTSTPFVGNSPLQLERLGVEVDDAIGDGRLAAIVVPPYGGLRLLWLALRGAVGGLGEASPLVRLDVERLVVRPSRLGRRTRIRVATDGEVLPLPVPLRIEVDTEPLRRVVPAPEDAAEVR